MSKRWYEHWLLKAARYERNNQKKSAVSCLNKAEKHTTDSDELKYLNLWRDRLRGEIQS